jgi:hypothetical protein
MMNLILLILLILAIFCLYLLDRNIKVYSFNKGLSTFFFDELRRILDTYKNDNEFHKDENNYNYIREKMYSLLDKHSYNEYLFSFKTLKLEKWFTKEELEFITYLKSYRK